MSFQPVNIVLFSVAPLPLQPKTLPQWWGYLTTDAIATVSASGYFNADPDAYLQNTSLHIGDEVYCVCSDGVVTLQVTALSPNVTTSAVTVTANSVNTAAIQNGAVTTAKIADANVTTAKIADANVTTAKIADANVTTAKIADANVTLAKLAAGITPSHVVKFGAQYTTTGGAAAEAITVTGALATDLGFCVIKDNGTANVTLLETAVTNDTLTLTFSADPGADTIVYYQILRAAA